mgnify:CR=1 FL=1
MGPSAPELIAPDGSPVAVFAALPPGPGPAMIHARLPAFASVLDLGCGAGRLSAPLADLGHPVTAVDVSPSMLAAVDGRVRTVCADIAGLDLGTRFDGVVLASYLVNHHRAAAFLATCARHVAPHGMVFVQRYDPLWLRDATPDATAVGNVTVAVDRFAFGPAPRQVRFAVTYRVDSRHWVQVVEAVIQDDDDVAVVARTAALDLEEWLDEHRTWALLRPNPSPNRGA